MSGGETKNNSSKAMVRDKIKDRQNSIRMYDEDGYLQRAACICVKNESEDEVLLVSSSRHSEQWIVPGGGVEAEETLPVAAMREVVEEAGVKGHIDRCLGIFQNEERRTRTAVFVLIVTEEMEEWEDSKNIGRRRKWYAIDEAVAQLAQHKPVQLDYLQHMRSNNSKNCKNQQNTNNIDIDAVMIITHNSTNRSKSSSPQFSTSTETIIKTN